MLDPIQEKLHAREMGQLPITIGTSLAFEGLFGIYPDRPESPAPLRRVKQVMVNVATLVRNVYQGLDATMKDAVLPAHIYEVVLEEMDVIDAAVVKQGEGNVKVVFYICNYASLPKKFRFAKLWEPKTERQRSYVAIESRVLKEIGKNNRRHHILGFDVELSGRFPSTYILTHSPVDLLSRKNFEQLELIESHTGKIKPFPAWYTKLTDGKNLTNMPFHRLTLQVFGDNSTHFQAGPPVLKKAVTELAETYAWTPVTTHDRIVDCVKKVTDPVAKGLLLALL